MLVVALLWIVRGFSPIGETPKTATSWCRREEQEVWLHFLLYYATPPLFRMTGSSIVSSEGRVLVRIHYRTKSQLSVLSSHLSWHYSPSFPRHSLLYPVPLKLLCSTEAKVVQDKFHCLSFYLLYGVLQELDRKHSIPEQQKDHPDVTQKQATQYYKHLIGTWKINCLNIFWSIFLITLLMNILFSVVLDLICLEDNCHYIKEQTVH